jgi:hypothetical protein
MSSGRVSWPLGAPLWTFLWEITDFDSEGVAFRDVRFRGTKVFHKASLPMIRVRYDSAHGPYKDPLNSGYMRDFKIYEALGASGPFLVAESYHKIFEYHIVNRWIFQSDGMIFPQFHSAGLVHPSNHKHHVYWRFDFDLGGAASNLALQRTDFWGDWGYGPNWWPLTGEALTTHFAPHLWAVINKVDRRFGYFIQSGPLDGDSSGFSTFDLGVVAYHGAEDLKGRLGTASDDLISTHVNGENVDGQDIVIWYVAHLFHDAHDNGDEYHVCGPILQPFSSWP